MGFNDSILLSPVLWMIAAGLFTGAGLARAARSAAKARDPEKSRERKIVLVCIYFSLAVFAGLLALIVPGPARFLDIRNLWLFIGATAVFFFAFRFKKSIMVPVSLLLLGFITMVLLFVQSIVAFTGETEVATVNVLALTDSKMELEVKQAAAVHPMFFDMEGEYFAPVVRVIVFDDLLVFFGSKTWYRFIGVSSYKAEEGKEIAVQKDIFAFPHPNGISEAMYAFFEKNEGLIPGIKTVQTDIIQKRAREFTSYSVRVQNDGGVEVIEVR